MTSALKLKRHIEEFHPKSESTKGIPSLQSFDMARSGTDKTLVASPKADDPLKPDAVEEEDEVEDSDVFFRDERDIAKGDAFALSTTQWTA